MERLAFEGGWGEDAIEFEYQDKEDEESEEENHEEEEAWEDGVKVKGSQFSIYTIDHIRTSVETRLVLTVNEFRNLKRATCRAV